VLKKRNIKIVAVDEAGNKQLKTLLKRRFVWGTYFRSRWRKQ
jgi:hypothetical protein